MLYNNENQQSKQLHFSNNAVSRPSSLKIESARFPPLFLSPRSGSALIELNSPDFRGYTTLTPHGQFGISPDLDKVFFQISGNGLSPLTPNSFLNPKMVTKDEDMFANNFTKKLIQIKQEKEGIHDQDRPLEEVAQFTDISYTNTSGAYSYDHQNMDSNQSTDGVYSFPSSSCKQMPPLLESAPSSNSSSIHPPSGPTINSLGETSRDGPSSICSGSTDIGSAVTCGSRSLHHIKLDRKRARNRDAARKCRERKLELIAQLQKQVSTLTENNKTLQVKKSSYQNEVERLKKFILEHVQSGCPLR